MEKSLESGVKFVYDNLCVLAPVVQTLDSAIHRINYYSADKLTEQENHTLCLKSDIKSINLPVTKIR